jgi:regulator of replication initiation timing
MTDDRISALEREIAKLRAEVADVREAIKAESDNNTHHIILLHKWVTTLAYKVMPEYAETREQIDGILGLKPPSTKQGKPA